MSYKVTSPLVAMAPGETSEDGSDSNNGPRYFYEGGIIPDGYNDERCEQLVKDGMLEKVKAETKAEPSGSEPAADSVEGILKAVGDDKAKAAAALEAEKAGKNRSTLVPKLEAIVNA